MALMSFLSSKFPESQPPGDSFAVMRGAREEGDSAVPGSGGNLSLIEVSVSTLNLETESPGAAARLGEALGCGSPLLESFWAAG